MIFKKVIITGGYGFIGRHLSKHLAKRGCSIFGIGHGTWSKSDWSKWGFTEWCSADVTFKSLKTINYKPDIIFHCAGSGSVEFTINNPLKDFQRSVASTAEVLEFIRVDSLKTGFVLLSSAGVYGNVTKLPISETNPLSPISPYGFHKKISEDLCFSYSANFDIKSSIVRLFSVYGEGLRKQLLWDACEKLNHNNAEFWGDGSEIRDWLYIDDAVKLLALAGELTSNKCPVINGGSGHGATTREVLEGIFSSFNWSESPQFTGSNRTGDPAYFVADISRALQLGWKPQKSLQDGIRDYVKWYKEGAH